MECPNCHHPLTPQHKFCSECGFPVAGTGVEQHDVSVNGAGTSRWAKAAGEYLRFVRNSLAEPAAFSARLGAGVAGHGLATAFFCCLFMTNLFYFTAGNVFTFFMGFLDFFPYGYGFRFGFLSHYVRPLFWIMVLHGITAGSVYAASRIMKSGLSFRDVLARYGSLLAAPAVLFALSSFFAFVGIYRLASFVSALGMIGWLAAAGYTVYSCGSGEQGGLDRFYGALAAFVIAGLSLYLLGELLF